MMGFEVFAKKVALLAKGSRVTIQKPEVFH